MSALTIPVMAGTPLIAPATLAAFMLAATAIELAPGPNMAFLALVSAREGRRAGLMLVAGVALGLTACLAASVAGLAEAAAATPWIYQVLRWGGIFYLVWLGWEAWRGDDGPVAGSTPGHAASRLIFRGFLINVLNPKNLVFYLTVLPAFISTAAGRLVAQALILGGVHVAIAGVVHLGIVVAAGSAGEAARARLSSPGVRGAFAASLIAVAGWIAWTTRTG